MRIFSKPPNYNFMGGRKVALVFSVIVIAASVGAFFYQHLNLGIDFTGGFLIEVGYEEAADLQKIRNDLTAGGYPEAVVQNFGRSTDVLVRLVAEDGVDSNALRESVRALMPGAELRRVDFVGPQVGEELSEKGGVALLAVLALIFIYIAMRFQWKFAAGAVAALIHDVVVTVGIFAVFHFEFDLSVLAAILAVIGYSLNDTVVVFDRIRENFRRLRKKSSEEVINLSINQMLARTIVTGVTTLLVLAALYFLGGEAIKNFSLALIIGVIVGTYSSVYVASAVALGLKITNQDLMPIEKRNPELDSLP